MSKYTFKLVHKTCKLLLYFSSRSLSTQNKILIWLLQQSLFAINVIVALPRMKTEEEILNLLCYCDCLPIPRFLHVAKWLNTYLNVSTTDRHLRYKNTASSPSYCLSWSYFIKSTSDRSTALFSHLISVVIPVHPCRLQPPPPPLPSPMTVSPGNSLAKAATGSLFAQRESVLITYLFLYSSLHRCTTLRLIFTSCSCFEWHSWR